MSRLGDRWGHLSGSLFGTSNHKGTGGKIEEAGKILIWFNKQEGRPAWRPSWQHNDPIRDSTSTPRRFSYKGMIVNAKSHTCAGGGKNQEEGALRKLWPLFPYNDMEL